MSEISAQPVARRFEVASAYVLGVLLPLLETLRRRTDFSLPEAYLDDYIAGALLLLGAWAVTRRRPYGPYALAGAWGVLCGGLYYSFFGQLRNAVPEDVSGLPNRVVVAIKGILFAVAILALVRSITRPASAPRAPAG